MKETKELQIKDNDNKINAAKKDQSKLLEKIKDIKESSKTTAMAKVKLISSANLKMI